MRNKLTITVVMGLAMVATAAGAETIVHRSARVSVDVPDNWKSESSGETLTLSDKHDDVAVTMVTVDDSFIKDATKAVRHNLEAKVSKLTFTEPKKTTINGMTAIIFDGDGFIGDTNIDLAVVVLDAPPKDKDLLIVAVAEDAKLARHKAEILSVFQSMAPVK